MSLANFPVRLCSHHSNSEGRTAWMVLDKFFHYLEQEVSDEASPVSSYEWGPEACRLAPAAPMVWSLHDTGKAEPLPVLDLSALYVRA